MNASDPRIEKLLHFGLIHPVEGGYALTAHGEAVKRCLIEMEPVIGPPHPTAVRILRVLQEHEMGGFRDCLTQKQIAARVGHVAHGSLKRHLQALWTRGLVHWVPGRHRTIRLTPKGLRYG